MRFDSLTALFVVSNAILGVSAGPLAAAKRQDDATTSSVRSIASLGLLAGGSSTIDASVPQATEDSPSATGSVDASISATPTQASETTATFSKTGEARPLSTSDCSIDSNAKNPFCYPANASTLYYDRTYYATWDPSFFPDNSTVIVQVRFANDSTQEEWSSGVVPKAYGFVSVDTKKEWMQGYTMYDLTFHLKNNEPNVPDRAAYTYDGPVVTLTNAPPNHYPAPVRTKLPDKAGLVIGLPVTLGSLLIIMIGLYFGMSKHRRIGLGNVMGRRKGYGVGKSRRQRMGLGKKGNGAIRLDERADYPRSQYQDQDGHSRGDSLGSLVSDDGVRPAPGGNQFRSEMDRQRTGR